MSQITLDTIARMASEVAQEQGGLDVAIRKEREAKAELLFHVVQAVKPALRALCSPTCVGARGRRGQADPYERHHQPGARSLVLVDDDPDRDGREGAALHLLEEGSLAVLRWKREDSKPLADWSWVGRLESCTEEEVVGRRWSVAAVAERLHQALQSHLRGKKGARTEAVEANVEKLRAVAVLVRGIERDWR